MNYLWYFSYGVPGKKEAAYFKERELAEEDYLAELEADGNSDDLEKRVAKRTAARKEKEIAEQKRNSPAGYYHAIPYDKFHEDDLAKIAKLWTEYRDYKVRLLSARKAIDEYNRPYSGRTSITSSCPKYCSPRYLIAIDRAFSCVQSPMLNYKHLSWKLP